MTGDLIQEEVGIEELADGIYFLSCIAADGREVVSRFVKTH